MSYFSDLVNFRSIAGVFSHEALLGIVT